MSHYNHLTTDERERIWKLRTFGLSTREIAKSIGRSASTVSRELTRNSGDDGRYSIVNAELRYQLRRLRCRRCMYMENVELRDLIMKCLWTYRWSPEQISKRLIHENSIYRISAATIYRSIYAGLLDKGKKKAVRLLRHAKKKYRRGGKTRSKTAWVTNPIAKRPAEVAKREELGHWEGDTVMGPMNSHTVLLTLTERNSRLLMLRKVFSKSAFSISRGIISLLSRFSKSSVKSMTVDRGTEFSQHKKCSEALHEMPFYFADPRSPWQRGTNENTNGLIREFIPKSHDIAKWSDEQIEWIMILLNARPRKCLGWKTPYEAFFGEVLHLI